MANKVTIATTTNKVVVNNQSTVVQPQVIEQNVVAVNNPNLVQIADIDTAVTVGNIVHTVSASNAQVTLKLIQNPVAVSVQSATIGVITGGIQGPEGAQGPTGPQGPTSGDEITVLNKTERKDVVEDSPSVGDITIYYGVANPQTATSSAAWLITRQIFLADGGVYDSDKKFASPDYDQIWDNRLGLTYT